MKYYVVNELTGKYYGPFNTAERAKAFKKKHHIWGYITEKEK